MSLLYIVIIIVEKYWHFHIYHIFCEELAIQELALLLFPLMITYNSVDGVKSYF